MKRTPLRRRSRLRSRKPLARSKPLHKRAARPARRPEGFEDTAYLAWLRTHACSVFCCFSSLNSIEAHHLRFDRHGRALGRNVKDDRRAISLCHCHHMDLHGMVGPFREMGREELRAWQEQQLSIQRGQYLASAATP